MLKPISILLGLALALNPAIADAKKKKKKGSDSAPVAAQVVRQGNVRPAAPATLVKAPAAAAQPSNVTAGMPSANADAPVATTSAPAATADAPGTTVDATGAGAPSPGATADVPGTTVDATGAGVLSPSATADASIQATDVSGAGSQAPGIGAEVQVPAEATQQPADKEDDSPIPLDDGPQPAYGEDPIEGTTHGSMRMLLQVRYGSTFVDSSRLSTNPVVAQQQKGTLQNSDGFDIQRAFLRYVASPSKRIDAKFLVDFAELKHNNVSQSFKLAYIETRPFKWLQIDFGLMKRPYSLLELLPIAKHELADLGPTDTFIKDQGYGGRDIGAIARFRPFSRRRTMTVSVGAYRGDIDEGFDASPLKLLGARIESQPWKHLRLGVNGAWRPFDNVKMTKVQTENADGTTVDTSYDKKVSMRKGTAGGVDATLLFRHLEVRAEFLYGKRTDMLLAVPGTHDRFWAAWLVVAPKIPIGKWLLVPAAKAELLDIDAMNSGGQRRVLTGVIGVMPTPALRIIVDVTRTWTDVPLSAMQNVSWVSGTPKTYVPEPSSTRATLQAHLVF